MSNYRRSYVPGGVFFLTIVTYRRIPLFSDVENISRLYHVRIISYKTPLPFKPYSFTSAFCLLPSALLLRLV